MGYIKDIKIGSGTANLIEPVLYATTGGTTSAFTAAISNFELVTGVVVTLKMNAANAVNATLNVNSTGAKNIKYKNTNIAANALSANRFYSFVYDNSAWQLIGELDTNTQTVTGVKGNAETYYRTEDVNLTAANIGAIAKNETGNTQQLIRPTALNGVNDITYQALINDVRANRLAFLPADQIIIEQTINGGSTWTDAGISDIDKERLFGEKREYNLTIPKINNLINANCGLRITITAMKYNVPEGTTETQKYNYWNSNYIKSSERYCQLKNMYFWVSTAYNKIKIKVERATGEASTTWVTAFDQNDYGMNGWSGNDIISFSQANFGGGTNQTTNYWNWRITLMSIGTDGSSTMNDKTTTSHVQTISEIRGYGDTWWGKSNEYMASDHLYGWDYQKNAIFPADILPKTNNNKNLGSSSYKWAKIYATNFYGSGANLTDLPAGQLTGSIADARLSANVSLLNANQTITGYKTFSVTPIITTNEMTFTSYKPYHYGTTRLPTKAMGLYANGIAISSPATNNDAGWVRMTGTSESDAVLEIGTSDDADNANAEKIVVSQYNSSTLKYQAMLLGKDGNVYGATTFPVQVTAPKFIGALEGNANTATSAGKWTTARSLTIGYKAQNVDGSGTVTWNLHDILYNPDIPIAQTTSWNTIIEPGVYGVASANAFTGDGHPGTDQDAPYTYGQLIVMRSSSQGAVQIYINDGASNGGNKNKGLRYRSGWDVDNNYKTWEQKWKSWATILDNRNFNFFAPKLDGTGATGTWNITATTATNLASAPSLAASGNNITVSAGGKTSSAFTVPYAAKAAATNIPTTKDAIAKYSNTTGTFANSDVTIDDYGNMVSTHTAGHDSYYWSKYGDTIEFGWGIGSGNSNHGMYDKKAGTSGKWIILADATNNKWTFDGNATSASAVPLSGVTNADDLKAIEALTGTSGFLKKTAANTWSLDTNTYLTSNTISAGKQYFLTEYSNNQQSLDRSKVMYVPVVQYNTVTPDYTSGGEQFYKAAMKYIAETYSTTADVLIGRFVPNASGPFIGQIYDNAVRDATTGLPQYSTFIFHNLNGGLESFGTYQYQYYYRKYVYTNNTSGSVGNSILPVYVDSGIIKACSEPLIRYGTSSETAATAAKTASIANFTLTSGVTVYIKFTNANSAATPTLNISSTGAKSITLPNGNKTPWDAGEVVSLTYDGTSWNINNYSKVEVIRL